MKKKILSLATMSLIAVSMLVGCGSEEEKVETKEKHKHNYTETITVEATCETDGEKTFTCECGDAYTEAIPAGHSFTNYVSNNDATYTADGTETAKCNNCDATDTRTAEGSMLTYTYTDMDATKYAKSAVNVRNLPNTDGSKVGSLSTNNEVKVTGQCNETGWYRIEYDGNVAYVSDSYLVDNKVETKKATNAQSSGSTGQSSSTAQSSGSTAQSSSTECPYELWTMYDNGSIAWFYMTKDHGYSETFWNAYNACHDYNRARYTVVDGQCPEYDAAVAATGASSSMNPTPYYVNGQRVYQYFGF